MIIYEHALDLVTQLIGEIKLAFERTEDVYAQTVKIDLWHKDGYRIGELRYEDDQWLLEPHNEP